MNKSIAFALAAVTSLAGVACQDEATGDRVVVPDFVGLHRTEAQCRLQASDLRWRFGADRTAHRVPALACDTLGRVRVFPDPIVVAQRPRPGARLPSQGVVVLEDRCTRSTDAGGARCL